MSAPVSTPNSSFRLPELLWLDLGMKLRRALAFRLNFAANLAISLLYSLLFSVFQFFVYVGLHGYPGWNSEQLLLFQAVLLLWTGTVDFLFGGVREFIDLEISHGNFDRLFVWPPGALVSLLSRGTNVHAAATVIAGAVGTCVLLARLDLPLGFERLLAFGLFFAIGIVFYVALLIVYSACTLFLVKMERLREVFDRVLFFASFPADLYAGSGKIVLLLAFPIGIWAYLPVQALLGRLEWYAFGAVPSACVGLGLALAFWRRQERCYASAGG